MTDAHDDDIIGVTGVQPSNSQVPARSDKQQSKKSHIDRLGISTDVTAEIGSYCEGHQRRKQNKATPNPRIKMAKMMFWETFRRR
jgi:hypothetical protein